MGRHLGRRARRRRRQRAHPAALRPSRPGRGQHLRRHLAGVRPAGGPRLWHATEVRRSAARCAHAAPGRSRQPHGLLRATERRRPAPRLHQARRQGRHHRRLRTDPDGRPHRRHRLGPLPAHTRPGTPGNRLRLVQPLGRVAAPVSRHAQDRPDRGLLHLRHRHGLQPPLERHPQAMPRRRRAQVPAGPHHAAPLPGLVRHGLWRTNRPCRHGPRPRQAR